MRIHPIVKKNILDLARIYVAIFNSTPWNENWNYQQAVDRLEWLFETKGFVGLVAYNDIGFMGAVMGCLQPVRDKFHFHIRELFVTSNEQNRGVGEGLLRELDKALLANNVTEVTLETNRTSTLTGYYKKRGFVIAQEVVLMRKPLMTGCKKNLD